MNITYTGETLNFTVIQRHDLIYTPLIKTPKKKQKKHESHVILFCISKHLLGLVISKLKAFINDVGSLAAQA